MYRWFHAHFVLAQSPLPLGSQLQTLEQSQKLQLFLPFDYLSLYNPREMSAFVSFYRTPLSVNFSLIATLHIIARHCCLINASTSSSGNFHAGVQGVVLLDEGDSVNWRRFLDDWLDGFRSCWHAKFVFYQLLMMSDWMISEIVDTYLCLCFTGYTQTQDILSG